MPRFKDIQTLSVIILKCESDDFTVEYSICPYAFVRVAVREKSIEDELATLLGSSTIFELHREKQSSGCTTTKDGYMLESFYLGRRGNVLSML